MITMPFPVTYLILLHLPQSSLVTVGKVGEKRLEPGYYTYVGSARQNAQSRLHRHIRGNAAKKRWHIDYLRAVSECAAVYIFDQGQMGECELARQVGSAPEVEVPIQRFGASDCRCPTHLFFHGDRVPTLRFTVEPAITLGEQEIRTLIAK